MTPSLDDLSAEATPGRDKLSPLERLIADALYADTWTEPRPDNPDWHHRFAWWQAACAARLAAAALTEAGLRTSEQWEQERLEQVGVMEPCPGDGPPLLLSNTSQRRPCKAHGPWVPVYRLLPTNT